MKTIRRPNNATIKQCVINVVNGICQCLLQLLKFVFETVSTLLSLSLCTRKLFFFFCLITQTAKRMLSRGKKKKLKTSENSESGVHCRETIATIEQQRREIDLETT